MPNDPDIDIDKLSDEEFDKLEPALIAQWNREARERRAKVDCLNMNEEQFKTYKETWIKDKSRDFKMPVPKTTKNCLDMTPEEFRDYKDKLRI